MPMGYSYMTSKRTILPLMSCLKESYLFLHTSFALDIQHSTCSVKSFSVEARVISLLVEACGILISILCDFEIWLKLEKAHCSLHGYMLIQMFSTIDSAPTQYALCYTVNDYKIFEQDINL